jgi:hypothetical protein
MQKRHQYDGEKRKRILPRKRATAQRKKNALREAFFGHHCLRLCGKDDDALRQVGKFGGNFRYKNANEKS